MTYNIHRAIGFDRRFRPSRIADIVRHHSPDVLLLQEVDDGVPRSKELDLAYELAQLLDYPHYVVGHNVPLRRGRYGNATLSRYPISRSRNIDLSIASRKRRGCQHSTLEITNENGSRSLDVFNLHLGLSAAERASQLGVLAQADEFVDLDESHHCMVAGDFNDWQQLLHPVFTEILGFDSATHRSCGTGRGLKTFPSLSPRTSLDRIYYRGPMQLLGSTTCGRRSSKVASDHLPVIADFTLH